jgi:hypothetical protein
MMFVYFFVINSIIVWVGSHAAHPTSSNCTWQFVEQPLSHFARGVAGSYQQRLCIFSEYWRPNEGLPVFLYTGNESPVEEYINNTGLVWDLAAEMSALIVFAEHRYFGQSIPSIEGMDNCLAYLSSEEALADYASLANRIRREWGAKESAVITFGGSYGGMLSSWMRILYPSAVDGGMLRVVTKLFMLLQYFLVKIIIFCISSFILFAFPSKIHSYRCIRPCVGLSP